MRVFLSYIENIAIAVPIEYAASIMIYKNKEEKQNESGRYISLPGLFNINNIETRHGIILKNCNFILLTSKIDCEIDLSEKEIFSMPKALEGLACSRFISGIKISKKQLVLVINPAQLIKYKHGEEA